MLPAAQAATILVWGDSLSAAYGIPQETGWPKLLEAKLKAEGYRYAVANASISGETTAGGLARLPAALVQHKPDVVILELGANDGLRGLSLDAMRSNLDTMIHASQKAGAKVLLVGMRMPPNLGPRYTDKFHATFTGLAAERRTALLPFLMEGFAGQRDLFIDDGIHPTAKAQPLILANLWPKLQPLLRK